MAGKITHGRDWNYFNKIEVASSTFSDDADVTITFPTQGILFINEESSGSTNKVVEISYNGNTVHGELDSSLPSRTLQFDNRVVSRIWFRVKSGSSGPITIRVEAWGIR